MSLLKKNWLIFSSFLLVFAAAFISYSNSFHAPFVFDDASYIVSNLHIKDKNPFSQLLNLPKSHAIRIVGYLTFAANYHVHQLDVFGYHCVNFIIHAFNSLLVYIFILLIFETPRIKNSDVYNERLFISFLTALIFSVHPIQTESVTFISQRFESLAAFFYLSSIIFYLKSRLSGRSIYFFVFVVFSILGMFTKETVFTLPLMVFATEWLLFMPCQKAKAVIEQGSSRWYMIILLVLLAIIPCFYGPLLLSYFTAIYESASHGGDAVTAGRYLMTQFHIIPLYLKLLIFPIGQNLDYDFPLSYNLFELKTLGGFVFLLFFSIFLLQVSKQHFLVRISLIWFFLTLAITSSVLPIRHVIFEHRLYLPLVGFALAISVMLNCAVKNKRVRLLASMIIIGTLMHLTYTRNSVWSSGITLWHDVVKKSPHKSRGYHNLASFYADQGFYDQALKFYTRAIEISPKAEASYNGRSLIYILKQDYDSAMQDIMQVISINPAFTDAYINRGTIYRLKNENEKALMDYNTALRHNPKEIVALINRANVYSLMGRYALALEDYNIILQIDSGYIQAYMSRGSIYARIGEFDRAIEDYSKAALFMPNEVMIYLNRAIVYENMNQYEQAVNDYTKALEIQPDNATVYYRRGVINKNLGRTKQAFDDILKAQSFGYRVEETLLHELKILNESIN